MTVDCISIQQPSCASARAVGYPLDTPAMTQCHDQLEWQCEGWRHIPAHLGDHIKQQSNKVACRLLDLLLELLSSIDDQSLLGCTYPVSWKPLVPPFSLDHHICSLISCWISTPRHEGAMVAYKRFIYYGNCTRCIVAVAYCVAHNNNNQLETMTIKRQRPYSLKSKDDD